MKMKTFIYLLIQTLVLGMWPWSCKDYVCLWNDCNNDLCFCVLHLKLWMLALIQGLALQSQGSFSFIKEGSYTSSSCATGKHIECTLITLVSIRVTCNIISYNHSGSIHLELYWKVIP